MNDLTTLKSRLLEPSTYAGLSTVALAVMTQLPPSYQAYAITAAAVFGGLAVVMRERGTKSPEEIAADAFAAARDIEAGKK